MATKPKDLETFLGEQSKSHYAFVVTLGSVASDVVVYPFSNELGIISQYRLSIPKAVIESINLIGHTVELEGRRHEVVNIIFTGDSGVTYEHVFQDLMANISLSSPTPSKPYDVDVISKFAPFKPLRDWCGWHWPSHKI